MVCSTCVLNSCLIQSVSKMTVFSLCNQWVYTLDFIKKNNNSFGFPDFGKRSTATSSEFGYHHQRKCLDQRQATLTLNLYSEIVHENVYTTPLSLQRYIKVISLNLPEFLQHKTAQQSKKRCSSLIQGRSELGVYAEVTLRTIEEWNK